MPLRQGINTCRAFKVSLAFLALALRLGFPNRVPFVRMLVRRFTYLTNIDISDATKHLTARRLSLFVHPRHVADHSTGGTYCRSIRNAISALTRALIGTRRFLGIHLPRSEFQRKLRSRQELHQPRFPRIDYYVIGLPSLVIGLLKQQFRTRGIVYARNSMPVQLILMRMDPQHWRPVLNLTRVGRMQKPISLFLQEFKGLKPLHKWPKYKGLWVGT